MEYFFSCLTSEMDLNTQKTMIVRLKNAGNGKVFVSITEIVDWNGSNF